MRTLLLLIFLFPVIVRQNATAQQNTDIDILKQLNQDWINSYPKKDAATLNRILADDLVLINPKGMKFTKSDIINNLSKQEIASAITSNVDVRLLSDNVGLITAYATFTMKTDGKEVTAKNCYQDIYVKRNGNWVAVAAHVTLLNGK